MKRSEGIKIWDPKEIIQPSNVADISLCDWCDPAFYQINWTNGRIFDPRNVGSANRFKTQELAIAFVEKHGFGGYRIAGKVVRLR